MKEKFEIKNLLGNKQKRTYRREVFRYYRAGFVLCLIIVALIYCATTFKTQDTLLSPLGQTISNPVVKVLADEDKPLTWNDAIREIFPADEAGKMIRICMKENGRQSKFAINHNTNGTYDYSWCQVNSCHKPNNMTDDEWKKNLEDPMFNAKQVRKIYLSQGWGAWVVYNKGLVK